MPKSIQPWIPNGSPKYKCEKWPTGPNSPNGEKAYIGQKKRTKVIGAIWWKTCTFANIMGRYA